MSLTVSVAMATFNGELHVAKQVESILGQSLLPAELVVADDGSGDRTLEIVRNVYARHPDTTVELRILPPAGHLGIARNFERAIHAAQSDLIALSDQDDSWHSDRLAQSVPSFEFEPQLLLQHSDARLVDAQGSPLGISLFEALRVTAEERALIGAGNAFFSYLRRNIVTGATVLIRRGLLAFASPFPDGWVHDEWLAIVASAVGKVELLDAQLIDYRQHSANVIGVTAPTLRYKIERMLEPRGDRYVQLASRARSMVDRFEMLEPSTSVLEAAREKSRFESSRAGLSVNRLNRLTTILSERRHGSYRRLSSQGNLDVLRDMLQPR